MTFHPGDNWCICDLTGKKVLMSQTRKTWDGLRVWEKVWYPKHPQLFVRAIKEHIGVRDGRPRPADVTYELPYGYGSFCLRSPDGTLYVVYVEEDGALFVREGSVGTPLDIFYLNRYGFTVDNDGALHVADVGSVMGPPRWLMGAHAAGTDATIYEIQVDSGDLAVYVVESVWYT
jgi:hypothetical protein